MPLFGGGGGAAASLGLRPGATWVALGDSTTQLSDQEFVAGVTTSYYGGSWMTFATALMVGRVARLRNAGVPGNTTTQMLARFDTDVTTFGPTIVTIMGGTNDIGNGVITLATTQANIRAMVAKCRGIGAVPVLCTICPSNVVANHGKISALNAWISRYAAQQGLVCLDLFSVLVDYTTGSYIAAYTADGTHPLAAGQLVMAQHVANNLPAMLPYNVAPICKDDTDPSNLLAHGLFNGAVAAGVSAGWNLYGGPVLGSNYSVAAAPAGILGKVQQIQTVATTANAYLNQNIAAGFAVGDRLLITGMFTITGTSPIVILVNYNGGTPGSSTPHTSVQPFTVGRFYQEFTVPPGTTSIDFFLQAGAGSGTVQLGQATVYNLTALGVL